MTFWWAWWLASLLRLKRKSRAAPVKQVPKRPKARTVAPYRRSDGTDELRRIH